MYGAQFEKWTNKNTIYIYICVCMRDDARKCGTNTRLYCVYAVKSNFNNDELLFKLLLVEKSDPEVGACSFSIYRAEKKNTKHYLTESSYTVCLPHLCSQVFNLAKSFQPIGCIRAGVFRSQRLGNQ